MQQSVCTRYFFSLGNVSFSFFGCGPVFLFRAILEVRNDSSSAPCFCFLLVTPKFGFGLRWKGKGRRSAAIFLIVLFMMTWMDALAADCDSRLFSYIIPVWYLPHDTRYFVPGIFSCLFQFMLLLILLYTTWYLVSI